MFVGTPYRRENLAPVRAADVARLQAALQRHVAQDVPQQQVVFDPNSDPASQLGENKDWWTPWLPEEETAAAGNAAAEDALSLLQIGLA